MRSSELFRPIVIWAAVVATVLAITFPVACLRADERPALSPDELKKALVVDPDPQAQAKILATIAHQPMADNDIIVPWIEQNADMLEPLLLMELSRQLFEQSHADALEWFAVALTRATYDARRCEDPSVSGGLAFVLGLTVRPFTSYSQSHPDEYATAQQRALARSDLFSDKVSPLWVCGHGMQVKPREQWAAIQESLRAEMQLTVHRALARQATRNALPKGTVELHLPLKGSPFSLAWSPNSELLAMTVGGDVAIWDVEAHSLLRKIEVGTTNISNVGFLDNAREIITSAQQDSSQRLSVLTTFNADLGTAIQRFGQVDLRGEFAVDETRQVIAYLARGIPGVAVIVADLKNPLDAAPVTIVKGVPSALAYSADGILAIGTLDGQILLLDSTHRLLRTIQAFDHDWVESLAFSPDGHYLASGSKGGRSGYRGEDGSQHQVNHTDTLKIWSVADGTLTASCSELVRNMGTSINSVAWSPDSRWLAFTGYNDVHLLDIRAPQSVKMLMQFSQGSGQWQYSSQGIAFSPDGKRLAVTGDKLAFVIPFGEDADLGTSDEASCK